MIKSLLIASLLIKKDIPRIELGLLDSKSNVLTITPYVPRCIKSIVFCFIAHTTRSLTFDFLKVHERSRQKAIIYNHYQEAFLNCKETAFYNFFSLDFGEF